MLASSFHLNNKVINMKSWSWRLFGIGVEVREKKVKREKGTLLSLFFSSRRENIYYENSKAIGIGASGLHFLLGLDYINLPTISTTLPPSTSIAKLPIVTPNSQNSYSILFIVDPFSFFFFFSFIGWRGSILQLYPQLYIINLRLITIFKMITIFSIDL